MSLPWFSFNADAYTGDTGHLTTEEHGAYLLLMLAYYRSEKPLPCSDKAMASLTKLSVAKWLDCKATLEPFFFEENGVWRHERIDAEISERRLRHEKWTNRARAGGVAKAAKDNAAKVLEADTSRPQATDEQPKKVPQLQLHLQSSSLSARANEVLKEGVPPQPPPEPEPAVSMPVSRTFAPSPEILERIMADADISTIHLEIQKFIFHHLESGSFSSDWQASFEKWWIRFIEHHKKIARPPRAAPRVEVNALPDWDGAITRWIKNQSHWSYKNFGPEPGQSGCRAPVDLLEKHGIDPVTGIIKEPAGP